MTTLGGIRTGLATRLATISGLRTSSFIPDQINPPVAVVMPSRISFDRAMHRGLDEYEFTVVVLVGRADERIAQTLLDDYCNPTGTSSIKTAIEGDRTLGGVVSDCRVAEMRGISSVLVGDTTYLTAEFVVSVFAQ
jgi:hypothetical protein